MKIGFVPIDNRPVCYTLPKIIAEIDENIEFFIPERTLLGDLKKYANIEKLFEWLKSLPKLDAIILSLDTLAYGGLISSRKCPEITNIIPSDILDDYLETRKRNFEINKIYLEWQKEGLFDTLIFSKDDCAEYGFNVQEAKMLEQMGGFTKTGADEIPLSLLSRAVKGKFKICPIFLEPNQKDLISNYEDISIEKSVLGQIELADAVSVSEPDKADIILYINNFRDKQGEIVMGINTEGFSKTFCTPDKPYMIADVRFANGADNNFVKELLKNKIDDKYFCGYSAWNTSANSLGSLICGAKIKYLAKKYNSSAFKKLQITRFLDDWAYQANIRQLLKEPNTKELCDKMQEYEKVISTVLNTEINAGYTYPWERLFEVEIELN